MTLSSNSVPENAPQTSGMPEKSVGVLLQRGGEELALMKVSDRFTVRPTSSTVANELTDALPIKRDREITSAQLQEFTVAPKQRDASMQAARNNNDIAFASHVYQLKDNPETLVYLTDQITIQFTQKLMKKPEQQLPPNLAYNPLNP
jgi:SAM-dependent MidA family methyltransferase